MTERRIVHVHIKISSFKFAAPWLLLLKLHGCVNEFHQYHICKICHHLKKKYIDLSYYQCPIEVILCWSNSIKIKYPDKILGATTASEAFTCIDIPYRVTCHLRANRLIFLCKLVCEIGSTVSLADTRVVRMRFFWLNYDTWDPILTVR